MYNLQISSIHQLLFDFVDGFLSFPSGSDGKESACDVGDLGSIRARKIPWRRKWQPTPVSLAGKSHWHRILVGYYPWSCKESDMTKQQTLSFHTFLCHAEGGFLFVCFQCIVSLVYFCFYCCCLWLCVSHSVMSDSS